MAEQAEQGQEQQQQEQQAMNAPFPAPPPFYTHFTKQHLTHLRQHRRDAAQAQDAALPPHSTQLNGDSHVSPAARNTLSLPPELRYLIPPQPPANDIYRSFGAHINLHAPERTLADAGIAQLYPTDPSAASNPQPHLIALVRSLLTTFLSLVDILGHDPTTPEALKLLEHIQTTMYNMHDLINKYRPHQARESLILMMEERVRGMREEVGRIGRGKTRVDELMIGLREAPEMVGWEDQDQRGSDGVVQDVEDAQVAGGGVKVEEVWRDRQRGMWGAMERVAASSS